MKIDTMNDNMNEETEIKKYDGEPIRKRSYNHILTGLFILAIGTILLLRQSGIEFPFWFFTWPVLLIAIGLFGAIKHRLQPGAWIAILAVGSIFLADRLIPGVSIQKYAWPFMIMVVGLWLIIKPKTHHGQFGRKCRNRPFSKEWKTDMKNKIRDYSNEESEAAYDGFKDGSDYIDSTSVFGGIKKIILSKNFKGGDITNFMGGTDINLIQADIQGPITIDATNIFGGTKLIVPSTWDVQSEVVAIFGGVDDKRMLTKEAPDPNKIVRLSGLCIFGGIEIKSY